MSRAFDTAYAEGGVPTWDIGRPQPAVARLVEERAFGEPGATVLDAGCGTGEHALLLTAIGYSVVGVDLAEEAIRRARAKATERGIDPAPTFVVGDVLDLAGPRPFDIPTAPGRLGPLDPAALGPFDAALDVGLFHTFADEDRSRYTNSLATVVRPGGRAFILCWSDRNPFGCGPRRVTRREVRATFRASAGWRVDRIEGEELASRLPGGRVHAWLVRLTRRA